MNHIYRTIYNTATQTWQTASELTKTQSTHSSQPAKSIASIAIATALGLFSTQAHADTASCTSSACSPNLRTIVGGFSNVLAPAVVSGSYDTNPNNNTVTVTGVPTGSTLNDVFGAYRDDNTAVSGNQVHISGGSIVYTVFGGFSYNGNATNNIVNMSGGSLGYGIVGGNSMHGDASNNIVNMSGGSLGYGIVGGNSMHGNANGNTVTISGGVVYGQVHGGSSHYGNANGNTVIISGGSIGHDVVGGEVRLFGNTHNNTITISGNPSFGGSTVLFGGNQNATGNTLNMRTTGITVRNIFNFENLNFYAPSEAKVNDTLLTLTSGGNTNISNSTISFGLAGRDSLLNKGDSINLIKKTNGTLSTPATLSNNISAMSGISALYKFKLKKLGTQTLQAEVISAGINPQVKSLSEARLAGMDFVNRGGDLAHGEGMNNLTQATQNEGINGFMALGGGKTRTATGSHIDVKGTNLLIGAGTSFANRAGKLTLGAYAEYGNGSYNSFNDFANRPDVHASGKTHYYGLGFMAQQAFNNGLFVEGGIRTGKTKLDYYSSDLVNAAGNPTRFETKSTYTGLNLGVGYKVAINDKTSITPYAKLLWTRYGSNRQVIAGSTFGLHSITALRSQLGGRFQYHINPSSQIYADLAWEREHKGTAKGTVLNFAMPEPTLKGNSGLVGAGVQFKPNKKLSLDFGVNGSFGKRRGVAATGKVKFAF